MKYDSSGHFDHPKDKRWPRNFGCRDCLFKVATQFSIDVYTYAEGR